MSIGHKIKKIRELKNYTQEHLAEKLNMSVTGYGKIERDEVDVPYSRLEQIAKTLDIDIEDLVSFDEGVVFNFNNSKISTQHFNLDKKIDNKHAELYEKTIKLLEDKIEFLTQKINYLEGEK